MGNHAQTFGNTGSKANPKTIAMIPIAITRTTPSAPISAGAIGMTARIAAIWAEALNPLSQGGTPWRASTMASSGQQSPSVTLMVSVAAMQAKMLRLRV